MKKTNLLLLITALLFTIVSCKPDKTGEKDDKTDYSTGVLVSNEGVFQTGNGDITYYNDLTGVVEANIFEKVNARPAGNVVQSVKRHGDYTFIVANNSNRVEVVNSKTFKSITTLKDIIQPRYYAPIADKKGYITSWNGEIYVVSTESMDITKTIKTGKNSDQVAIVNGNAWVVNSGGYVYDNTISIINTSTDEVIKTISTEHNPKGIEVDSEGKVWVLCGGNSFFDFATETMTYITSPRITCFDATTFAPIKIIQFENLSDYVSSLTISKDRAMLYFVNNNKIFSLSTSGSSTSDFKEVYKPSDVMGFINSIKMNPKTNKLFVSDAKDYNSNGEVIIVNPSSGAKESGFKAGIIPGGFDF